MASLLLAIATLAFVVAGSTTIVIAGRTGSSSGGGGSTTVLDVEEVLQSLHHSSSNQDLVNQEKLLQEQDDPEVMSIVHSSHFSRSTRSHRQSIEARLARDAARVEAIAQRLDMALNHVKHSDLHIVHNSTSPSSSSFSESKADAGSPVTSGLSSGSGEYFVRMGIGSPAKLQYLVMDTGSDVAWIQCAPCQKCYEQNDAIFEPSKSTSFRRLSCSSPQCKLLDVKGCASTDNRCLYQVAYGDGSFTVGDLASDYFSVTRGRSTPLIFGCGHDNEGLFVGAAGLLGLGAGKLSFPSQLYSGSRKFSYCLVTRDNGVRASSALLFGQSATPSSASFEYTQLIKNPRVETYYYAGLQGISVAGELLSIPSTSFKLSSSNGRGGVIVDSGTSVTRLPTTVYTVMRDAFRKATKSLPRAPQFSLFDTCYDFSALSSVTIPTMAFHFDGGASIQMPPTNYLVPVDNSGTFCFAFSKTAMDLSIIGNIQQQTMRVVVDLDSSRIGFAPRQCT